MVQIVTLICTFHVLIKNPITKMTAGVQGNESKHTRGQKGTLFYYVLDKTMCTFWANFDFDKATNGQRDIKKHEMWEILSLVSLLQIVGE